MKEPGYVYILTNPSFKEDWVKIGKSSRPVDIRSKELDNTAVPLPFEIYATLKTVKYEEVERQLHRMIDRLTDLRIRPNREFFNVPPTKALELLKDCAMTIDDAEIQEHYNSSDKENGCCICSVKKTEKYKSFWADFIQYCKDKGGVFANISPINQEWISKGIGVPYGINMCAVIGRDLSRIEIYFNSGNREMNKKVFDYLYSRRSEIEAEYGRTFIWQRLDDKKACRIKDEREYSFLDATNKDFLFAFLKEASEKMSVIFHKYILQYEEQ